MRDPDFQVPNTTDNTPENSHFFESKNHPMEKEHHLNQNLHVLGISAVKIFPGETIFAVFFSLGLLRTHACF